MRNTVDTSWVLDQFESAKVQIGVGNAVLQLLEAWEKMDVEPEQVASILEVFEKVAQHHALLPDESTEVWIEAIPGSVRVGDTVRVRVDAYSDASGQYHNGRIGKVTGVRSGDIIVRSTDNVLPSFDGAHYRPEKLEQRVQ